MKLLKRFFSWDYCPVIMSLVPIGLMIPLWMQGKADKFLFFMAGLLVGMGYMWFYLVRIKRQRDRLLDLIAKRSRLTQEHLNAMSRIGELLDERIKAQHIRHEAN